MEIGFAREHPKIDIDLLITSLDTVSEGLIIVDNDNNLIYKNRNADRLLLGQTKDIELGQWTNNFQLYDLKTNRKLIDKEMPLSRALFGLKFNDYQVRVVHGDNSEETYLSVNGTPLIAKNLEIIGAVLTFKDITSSYLSEKRLKQEKAFYKNILDWIPGAIFIYSEKKEYFFKNHRFEQFQKDLAAKGLSPEEVINKIASDHDEKVLKSYEAMQFDEFLELPDRKRYFSVIRFPIYHQPTNKLLICGIAFDQTDKKEMEQKMEAERVKSINASKLAAIGTLAGEIGHEIHNPVSVVRSITFMIREMLIDGKLNHTILKDKLDLIDSTIDRVAKIIKSLKNLSRKSSNEKKEPCTLKAILSDVLALSDLKLKKNNVKVIIDKKNPVLERLVNCYQIQFSQVLINLISNAVDATHGYPDAHVEIQFKEDEKFIYIRVLDNGAGIPEEHKDKLFEPFFTTKDINSGTGLGLSISKNIMSSQEGDLILCENEERTCFEVKIPKLSA